MTELIKTKKPLRVVYLLLAYPKLTVTFVDREVMALRGMGVDVRVCAIERRAEGLLSDYQKDLQQDVAYLFPARLPAHLAAHLRFAFTRPKRYFSTLFYLLTRPHPSLFSHRRTLNHFHQGVFAAHRLRKEGMDQVHAHFLNQSATVAMVVARLLGIPYSVTVHASGDLYSNPLMIPEKLADARFIATCTSYNRSYLLEKFGKELDSKVKVIYHGLDAKQYQNKSSSVDLSTKPAGPPVILSVGQLRERKGFSYLIEACAWLKQHGANFKCNIIGEGPLQADLQAQIQRFGLGDQVTLCGPLAQEQVIGEYQHAAIFALPAVLSASGDRDGIPNVVLEAMAMELPVVSTWHSGLPEVIENGRNGLLVPPKDVEALAKALLRLLTQPSLCRRLGAAGRQTVLEKFDPERNARQLLQAFTR